MLLFLNDFWILWFNMIQPFHQSPKLMIMIGCAWMWWVVVTSAARLWNIMEYTKHRGDPVWPHWFPTSSYKFTKTTSPAPSSTPKVTTSGHCGTKTWCQSPWKLSHYIWLTAGNLTCQVKVPPIYRWLMLVIYMSARFSKCSVWLRANLGWFRDSLISLGNGLSGIGLYKVFLN